MTDSQLLGILIGNNALSTEILNTFKNDLTDIAKNIITTKIKGLGNSKMRMLAACFELGRRKAKQDEIKRLNAQKINNSTAIFAQFNQELSDLDYEELWALYMSKNGTVLKKVRISEGGVDATSADIKKIVKPAIDLMASYVALCHNHPHSTTRPSRPDRELTENVKKALTFFDIRLLDHIIIADGRYYSFADNGEL